MQDYSIDIQAEKIYANTTKEYFKEVIRSYYGENYRATIVTLYSIVIYDMLNKLEVLRDAYGDKKAESILQRIETTQTNKPKSPEWESELIELIKKETKLLDTAEALHIDNLQQIRHLCAHPVRNSNYELFSPNKETVRAHLRNMLEAVLTKRPLSSKNIFEEFIIDIAAAKFRLLSNENILDRYISSKYLDNISIEAIKQLIKKLWKFVFVLQGAEPDSNRAVNTAVLYYLVNKYYTHAIQMIKSEPDYYSNINLNFAYQISYIINSRHEIFSALRNSEQDALLLRINGSADLHAYAWFTSTTIDKHTDLLQSEEYTFLTFNFNTDYYISTDTLAYLENILRPFDPTKANTFSIAMYRKSHSYDSADERYNYLIHPNLKHFSKDDFELLLAAIESNSQIYHRRNAYRSMREIKAEIETRFAGKINYSAYANFSKLSS